MVCFFVLSTVCFKMSFLYNYYFLLNAYGCSYLSIKLSFNTSPSAYEISLPLSKQSTNLTNNIFEFLYDLYSTSSLGTA